MSCHRTKLESGAALCSYRCEKEKLGNRWGVIPFTSSIRYIHLQTSIWAGVQRVDVQPPQCMRHQSDITVVELLLTISPEKLSAKQQCVCVCAWTLTINIQGGSLFLQFIDMKAEAQRVERSSKNHTICNGQSRDRIQSFLIVLCI